MARVTIFFSRFFFSRHARRATSEKGTTQCSQQSLPFREQCPSFLTFISKDRVTISLYCQVKQVMSELVDIIAWCSIKEPVLIICMLKHMTTKCQPVRKEVSLNLEMKESAIVNLYLPPNTSLSQITDDCEIWLLCLLLNDWENYFIVFGWEQTNFNFHLHGIVLSGQGGSRVSWRGSRVHWCVLTWTVFHAIRCCELSRVKGCLENLNTE